MTLAATGGIMTEVLQAADELAEQNIHCRVLSVHTLKPLQADLFERSARETGGLITIEEHTVDGGLGGVVAELLMESGSTPAVFRRIGLRGGFSSIVGSQQYLRTRYAMDAPAIAQAVKDAMRAGRRKLNRAG